MADFPDSDALGQAFSDEVEAITEKYLSVGLDPAYVFSTLAAVIIKTTQADPIHKDRYLNYIADVMRAAVDITIVDK